MRSQRQTDESPFGCSSITRQNFKPHFNLAHPPWRFACFSRPRQITCFFMRWQKGSLAICLGLTWLSLGQVSQASDDQPPREIVDRVGRLFISQSSIATMEMQITKEDWQRKISMQFWSLGESN